VTIKVHTARIHLELTCGECGHYWNYVDHDNRDTQAAIDQAQDYGECPECEED